MAEIDSLNFSKQNSVSKVSNQGGKNKDLSQSQNKHVATFREVLDQIDANNNDFVREQRNAMNTSKTQWNN